MSHCDLLKDPSFPLDLLYLLSYISSVDILVCLILAVVFCIWSVFVLCDYNKSWHMEEQVLFFPLKNVVTIRPLIPIRVSTCKRVFDVLTWKWKNKTLFTAAMWLQIPFYFKLFKLKKIVGTLVRLYWIYILI